MLRLSCPGSVVGGYRTDVPYWQQETADATIVMFVAMHRDSIISYECTSLEGDRGTRLVRVSDAALSALRDEIGAFTEEEAAAMAGVPSPSPGATLPSGIDVQALQFAPG